MARTSTTTRIEADSPLREQTWLDQRGEPVAWLDLGAASELGIYGSPDAVRRLGRALLTLADCVDQLATPAAVAVAESGDTSNKSRDAVVARS